MLLNQINGHFEVVILINVFMGTWAKNQNTTPFYLWDIVPPQIQEESSRQLKRGAVTYTIVYTYFFWSFNLSVTHHSTHLSNTSPTNTGFESLLSYAPGAMKFTIWLWWHFRPTAPMQPIVNLVIYVSGDSFSISAWGGLKFPSWLTNVLD